MTDQDPGTYTPEGGTTWPDFQVIRQGTGDMLTVRSDSAAFQNTAMRAGTLFMRNSDGTFWLFDYFDAEQQDPAQGGTMYVLTPVRPDQQ